jgi:hypothetical protein
MGNDNVPQQNCTWHVIISFLFYHHFLKHYNIVNMDTLNELHSTQGPYNINIHLRLIFQVFYLWIEKYPTNSYK